MSSIPVVLSPSERRKTVALAVTAGKSNRAIAKALGVDETTIRRDRKFLAEPAKRRPTKIRLPEKPRVGRLGREVSPDELREKASRRLLDVAKTWLVAQISVIAEVEYAIEKAGKLLHIHRLALNSIRTVPGSPSELLEIARPARVDEDDVTGLESLGDWLARWLALCLPQEEEQQREVLRELSIWARSSPRPFVY